MSARSCGDCANAVSWEEYGCFCWDCRAEPAASSVWRERLDSWGIDPGPYCGQYVYFDARAYAEAQYLAEIEIQITNEVHDA